MPKWIAGLLITVLLLGACNDSENVTQKAEQNMSEENQARLLANQPPPQLEYSLERENLYNRTMIFNDKNKISYIYLLSDMGQIYAFLVIKGKVSSVNSQITTPEQVVCRYAQSCVTTESPAEDGSYGTNGDAVFFFTPDNTYIEWNGKYLLADRPMQLSQQPLMIQSEQEITK